jgi:hypothetical protein
MDDLDMEAKQACNRPGGTDFGVRPVGSNDGRV